jgi:hypothetical protein
MPTRPDREAPADFGPYGKSAENGYMQGVKDRERLGPLSIEQWWPLSQKALKYCPLYATFSDGKRDQLLEQLLRHSAAEFGDQYMINILNTRGLQGAAYYIGWIDAMTKLEAVRRPGN